MNKKMLFLIPFIFTQSYLFLGAIVNVKVDYSIGTDFPLLKTKIGLYQTPLTSGTWLKRDIPRLSELETRVMRYEIAWGKNDCYGYEMIQKNATEGLIFNFNAVDVFSNLVSSNNANLLMCHSYTPKVAGAAWIKPPTDYVLYKDVNKNFARHWNDLKLQNHYIEVWNEPDLTNIFFNGTIDDYFNIYKYATQGILEGDPDAKIGGPAGASSGWFTPLLQKCKDNNWPINFLSGHNYGDPTQQLANMREALTKAQRPDVEILMTEYAPYNTTNGDTHAGGLVERYEAGMTFFNAIDKFFTYPDLTHVYWAQYIDAGVNGVTLPAGSGDKMGLVDGNTGKRKALFNAFKIFGLMPVDRYSLTSSSANIKGFASSDPDNAGVVLWNTSANQEDINITINNLPFSTGMAKLYRIDPQNSWYETRDDELKVLQEYTVNSKVFTWNGTLPASSVVFIKFEDLTGKSELVSNPFAYIIKTNHWYFNRSEPAYADFDSKTWITRLGMGNSKYGDAVIGIYAKDIPSKFNVKYIFSGSEFKQLDQNSTVNFRIDFQNTSGQYLKSVLFHGGLYNPSRESKITWGTKDFASEIVQVDLSDFDIDLSEYAPANWNGKAILSYQMQNTGENTRAKIFVKAIEKVSSISMIEKKKLKVFPNSDNSTFSIDFSEMESGLKDIVISNLDGKVVKKIDHVNSRTVVVNTQGLPPALYIIKVIIDGHNYIQKIIKQ